MTHSGGCGLAVVPSAVAVELAKETKGIGIRKVFWVECIAFPGPSAAADEGPGAPGTRLKNSKCKSKRNETVPQGLKAVIDLMDSTYGLKSVPFEVRLNVRTKVRTLRSPVPQGLKAVIDLMDSTYGLKSVPFEVRSRRA